MFIMSKANINLKCQTPAGTEKLFVPRDFLGKVPEKFVQTEYFNSLVKTGKIVITASKRDEDLRKAQEAPIEDTRENVKKKSKKK